MNFKPCNKCKVLLPIDNFNERKSASDGLNYYCKLCKKESDAKSYKRNKNKRKITQAEYTQNNKEKIAATRKKYYENNKAQHRDTQKRFRKRNTSYYTSKRAKRRAAELQATPSWVNYKAIETLYQEAYRLEQEDGIKIHIDHIHPLQGENICGFHIYENLQILTETENLKKGKKFKPYVESEL